jgi:hypothetical protein
MLSVLYKANVTFDFLITALVDNIMTNMISIARISGSYLARFKASSQVETVRIEGMK